MSAVLRLTRSSLRAHTRRLLGMGTAVVLGVTFLAATLVLGDTMRESFDRSFEQANAGVDLLVRDARTLGDAESFTRPDLPDAMVDRLGDAPGVAAAAPSVMAPAQIVGADGDPIGGKGPPTFGTNWIDDPELNPYRIAVGRAPERPGEVVVDHASADDGDLHVGDRTTVLTPAPVEVEVVGVATFGSQDSFAGTTLAAFATEQAQDLFAGGDGVGAVLVRAEAGTSTGDLRAALAPLLGDDVEVLTGQEVAQEQQDDIESTFLGFLRTALVVFAGVALVVAAVSIHNTFTIVVAQRAREAALLRAIGASRAQVLGSVVLEAVAVGLVASLIGLGTGLGAATGLRALLASAGLELSIEGLVVTGAALVVPLVVGVVVTVAAGLAPAVRAAAAPPLAALRDGELDPGAVSLLRAGVGGVLLTGGVALAVAGASSDDGMRFLALGALASVVGAVAFAPVLARPVGSLLGLPAAVLHGATGRIARRNVVRNPRRTASSATALLVGVAVVVLFATMGASIKRSLDHAVDRSFGGDLVIGGGELAVGIDPTLAERASRLPEVERAVAIDEAVATVDGETTYPAAVDPDGFASVLDLDVAAGSVGDLAPGEVAVSEDHADDHGLRLGDEVEVGFADGAGGSFRIGAVYRSAELVGPVVLHEQDWAPHARDDGDVAVLVALADGVGEEEGAAAVQRVADDLGAPDVLTRDEYTDSIGAEVDQVLVLVYGLLGLAVVIALMGIANALSLAVHERTRELGLLRAVGQTRRQVRATVRWEAAVVAVFGTLAGAGLGTFLGWTLVRALQRAEGFGTFSLPVGSLVVVVALAVAAGLLAAARPARRAARLDVIAAIGSE